MLYVTWDRKYGGTWNMGDREGEGDVRLGESQKSTHYSTILIRLMSLYISLPRTFSQSEWRDEFYA